MRLPLFIIGVFIASFFTSAALAGPESGDKPKAPKPLECPSGAKAFGGSPPNGFEEWCAKPPATPDVPQIYHGTRRLWHPDGTKLAEGQYLDGEQVGIAKSWYSNGQQRIEEHYEAGSRHGLSTAWYPNGKKKGEGNFSSGKEEGHWIWWHENGAIAVKGQFKAGERAGSWIFWNELGQQTSVENFSSKSTGKP